MDHSLDCDHEELSHALDGRTGGLWHECRCGYRRFFGQAPAAQCTGCDPARDPVTVAEFETVWRCAQRGHQPCECGYYSDEPARG